VLIRKGDRKVFTQSVATAVISHMTLSTLIGAFLFLVVSTACRATGQYLLERWGQ